VLLIVIALLVHMLVLLFMLLTPEN
jgi:hypothetical protein